MASTSRYCSTVSSAQRRHVQRSSDPATSGGADAGAQLGIVEATADRVGEGVGVAGAALQHRLAVACR